MVIFSKVTLDRRLLHNRYSIMEKENKTYSMSIRVTEEELVRLKQAARLEAYASYSEFVRRTALLEASKVLKDAEYNETKKNSKSVL